MEEKGCKAAKKFDTVWDRIIEKAIYLLLKGWCCREFCQPKRLWLTPLHCKGSDHRRRNQSWATASAKICNNKPEGCFTAMNSHQKCKLHPPGLQWSLNPGPPASSKHSNIIKYSIYFPLSTHLHKHFISLELLLLTLKWFLLNNHSYYKLP